MYENQIVWNKTVCRESTVKTNTVGQVRTAGAWTKGGGSEDGKSDLRDVFEVELTGFADNLNRNLFVLLVRKIRYI